MCADCSASCSRREEVRKGSGSSEKVSVAWIAASVVCTSDGALDDLRERMRDKARLETLEGARREALERFLRRVKEDRSVSRAVRVDGARDGVW